MSTAQNSDGRNQTGLRRSLARLIAKRTRPAVEISRDTASRRPVGCPPPADMLTALCFYESPEIARLHRPDR